MMMMISSRFFITSTSLPIFLLLFISPSLLPNAPHTACTASPAGVEAVLDPLGDLVQVAPSLALHQEELEKSRLALSSSSIKSIKTPTGTVKCSCKTVPEEEGDDNGNDDELSSLRDHNDETAKTIEIEIYKPVENGDDDDDNVSAEGESQKEPDKKNNQLAVVRNSFSLDEDDASAETAREDSSASLSLSQHRVFSSTEEETAHSFLSFLHSLVSSSVQAEALSQTHHPLLRANEPEKIETEAELESEPVDNQQRSSDDLASLNGDVNLANHRISDMVAPRSQIESTLSSDTRPVYKSFHTAELIEDHSPFSATEGDGGNSSEKMDSVGGKDNLGDEYLLWDFIHAGHGAGKKGELLQLGTMHGPFQGPRRRRRKRSLRGNGNNSPVVFVYPVGYNPPSSATGGGENDQKNEIVIPTNKTKTKPELSKAKIQLRSEEALDKEEVRRAMQEAMARAWQQYGPKGLDAPPVTPAPPSPVYIIPASKKPPEPPLPGKTASDPEKKQQQNQQKQIPHPQPQSQKQELIYYTPPRPFLFIDRIFDPFQPMTSEWDKHVTSFVGPPPRPPEPGFFSRFLASYIDFEVNNHEAADLMRKVVFGIVVGFLIAGWIALGAAFGIVPFKKLLAFVAGANHYDAIGTKRIDKGKGYTSRDTTLAELTNKISLSLDANWLKKLEERVMDNQSGESSGGTKIPTQVFCCILPDEQTQGIVECQVNKGAVGQSGKKKQNNAFKCITNLIYNFHFGPRENEERTEEDEQGNNVKGKAKNDSSNKQEIPSESESVFD